MEEPPLLAVLGGSERPHSCWKMCRWDILQGAAALSSHFPSCTAGHGGQVAALSSLLSPFCTAGRGVQEVRSAHSCLTMCGRSFTPLTTS